MLQKFINWLLSLSKWFSLSRKQELYQIPSVINSHERLCRSIYSPINVDGKGRLKSNAFRTPPNKDEVSVNRLDFTTPNFCKDNALRHENPSASRSYFGFAVIGQKEVLESDCTSVYSPINTVEEFNPYHADIKIGVIPIKGEELPSRFRKKVDDLVKKARFYKDPYPTELTWLGPDLN